MTRADFYKTLATQLDLKAKDVKAVFAAAHGLVLKTLKKEGKLPLGDICSIRLRQRKARTGRNPATGESIQIPAKTVVKVLPAASLKRAFNKKG
jgi:nucleoid DNA-binding protein